MMGPNRDLNPGPPAHEMTFKNPKQVCYHYTIRPRHLGKFSETAQNITLVLVLARFGQIDPSKAASLC